MGIFGQISGAWLKKQKKLLSSKISGVPLSKWCSGSATACVLSSIISDQVHLFSVSSKVEFCNLETTLLREPLLRSTQCIFTSRYSPFVYSWSPATKQYGESVPSRRRAFDGCRTCTWISQQTTVLESLPHCPRWTCYFVGSLIATWTWSSVCSPPPVSSPAPAPTNDY